MILAFLALCLQSCVEDKCTNHLTYTKYESVYLMSEDIRIDIASESPRELKSPGKIYFYNNYVLINEIKEGIHIIDNADPSNPNNIAFIPIPGNVDMAVRNNILYADNYMDLLAINITNITSPSLEKRVEDVFSWYNYNETYGYHVYYEKTNVTEEISCDNYWYGDDFISIDGGILAAENTFNQDAGTISVNNSQTGIAGSMARFGLAGEYLYAIDDSNLDVFNISDITCPEAKNEVYVGWGIETIFPYGNHLFIGAADGMYIFDNSNPETPEQLSKFQHARACDPVYVSGNRAFVTLRNGNPECDGFENQLDIVNIEDLMNPSLIQSYTMDNPHGLSVTPNNKLFLCEGNYGIKILNVEDSFNVNQIGSLTGFDAYDAIALGENHVMIIGKDGFYQFDTEDPNDIKQLSLIPVYN